MLALSEDSLVNKADVIPFLKARQTISVKSGECLGSQLWSPREPCLVVREY